MGARYLIRFDDVCPTMNWRVWSRLEPTLRLHGVRPILSVVPDNRDPNLAVDTAKSDFWSRVREWQASGWTIALHGHQHVYSTRHPGLMGINAFSEFAGLDEEQQRNKLDSALRKFRDEGVRADAWVAPGHSFDAVTVKLLIQAGVEIISDGFYTRPVRHLGACWVPQQLWRFRAMPGGLWTVCYHPNRFDASDIERFAVDVGAYADRITSMPSQAQMSGTPQRGALDRMFASAWLAALRLKRLPRAE
jgi:predicted deacetylase